MPVVAIALARREAWRIEGLCAAKARPMPTALVSAARGCPLHGQLSRRPEQRVDIGPDARVGCACAARAGTIPVALRGEGAVSKPAAPHEDAVDACARRRSSKKRLFKGADRLARPLLA